MPGACTLPCFADMEVRVHCWLSVELVGLVWIGDYDFLLTSSLSDFSSG